ncbi:HsdM family class I SAM-dependent methyltransferase [Nostoc sp.]|uniref:HsdM family class I SAM-dependent methyltransferase n=1 Tax=Nostoc sp. TaxID=1180 RepID=UPI002FF8C86B
MFTHGYCPETGKKADLMFAQHMLSVLKTDGMMATVMPHGVLFRGGEENKVRESSIKNDRLEAGIGLPPNFFYGTGIPACILVMAPKYNLRTWCIVAQVNPLSLRLYVFVSVSIIPLFSNA